MNKAIIDITSIHKDFMVGEQNVHVLKDVSFSIYEGDFLVIFGPSGCGKSTLLHIILGLEGPTTGNVTFLGEDFYTGKDEDDISGFRKQHVGMVYQQANWIKALKVGENVAFPLLLLGEEKPQAFEKAKRILEQVELVEWFDYAPTELSSGQQQRISLARALVHNPQVIIADEPTGNLDFKSGQEMMELLAKLNTEQKKTVIMVTHDLEYLKFANRAVQMLDGKIQKVFEEGDKKELMGGLHFKRGGGTEDGPTGEKGTEFVPGKQATKESEITKVDKTKEVASDDVPAQPEVEKQSSEVENISLDPVEDKGEEEKTNEMKRGIFSKFWHKKSPQLENLNNSNTPPN